MVNYAKEQDNGSLKSELLKALDKGKGVYYTYDKLLNEYTLIKNPSEEARYERMKEVTEKCQENYKL